jgi:hypothetical protein
MMRKASTTSDIAISLFLYIALFLPKNIFFFWFHSSTQTTALLADSSPQGHQTNTPWTKAIVHNNTR